MKIYAKVKHNTINTKFLRLAVIENTFRVSLNTNFNAI